MANFMEGHINRDHGASSGGGLIDDDKVERPNIIESESAKELKNSLKKIEIEMREKGLESDAEIVKRAIDRFSQYIKRALLKKVAFETGDWGGNEKKEKVKLSVLTNMDPKVHPYFPVTHEIGKRGGLVYNPSDSYISSAFSDDRIQEIEQARLNLEEQGKEIINYSFSEEGKKLFEKIFKELYNDVKNNNEIKLSIYNSVPIKGQPNRGIQLSFNDKFLDSLAE